MSKLFGVFVILLSIVFISCVQNDLVKKQNIQHQNQISNETNTDSIQNKSDSISILCQKLVDFIILQYFKSPDYRDVNVHLKEINNNLTDRPGLSGFLYAEISEWLSKKHYCTRISPPDAKALNCIIEMHLIDNRLVNPNSPVSILGNVLNAVDGNLIFSEKINLGLNELKIIENSSKYKLASKPVRDKNNSADLIIKAINIGSSYKADDKYYLERTYGFFGIYDTIWKKETGASGYYPAAQKCTINGKQFDMDRNNIFFNGEISSGNIEIVTAFRKGFWDAYNNHQKIGDKFQKRFYLNVKKAENVRVDIIFIYRGYEPAIEVKAYRVKEIKQGNNIETVNEIIDVF
jgi:hypothetical protein